MHQHMAVVALRDCVAVIADDMTFGRVQMPQQIARHSINGGVGFEATETLVFVV